MGIKDKQFLVWLSNRLVYKHGYQQNDNTILKLGEILSSDSTLEITDSELDLILSKYYIDFFLEKAEDINIGYTPQEREELRKLIRSLVTDIINRNIPTESLLK